jgi:cation/acetate symporter
MRSRLRSGVAAAAAIAIASTSAIAEPVANVAITHHGLTFLVFSLVIGSTLLITWFASRRNQTAGDFYTAGGAISPVKNGLAIAGDYLSAAAFLGASGLIALYGFDGVIYLVGFFASFIPVISGATQSATSSRCAMASVRQKRCPRFPAWWWCWPT